MPVNAYTPRQVPGAPVATPQNERPASDAERAASTVMRAFANATPSTVGATSPGTPDASAKPAEPEETATREGALYTLEAAVHCPECQEEIPTLRVLRVLRTQVSFTSTLPRKGYVVVCPQCERMLSAALSGLV